MQYTKYNKLKWSIGNRIFRWKLSFHVVNYMIPFQLSVNIYNFSLQIFIRFIILQFEKVFQQSSIMLLDIWVPDSKIQHMRSHDLINYCYFFRNISYLTTTLASLGSKNFTMDFQTLEISELRSSSSSAVFKKVSRQRATPFLAKHSR